MPYLPLLLGLLPAVGAALVSGIFYAFSSFVMKALGRLDPPEGIRAMQSINVVVLNVSFLGLFMGTAVLSLLAAGLGFARWGEPWAPWYVAGGVAYIVGCFLVTGLGNVPLNNRLEAANPADPAAHDLWRHYLRRWTMLNTVRTVGSLVAAVLFAMGVWTGG